MTKEQASKEAKEVAERDKLDMVVTFNPYGEEESDDEKFGYFPAGAVSIFKYEEVVETILTGRQNNGNV